MKPLRSGHLYYGNNKLITHIHTDIGISVKARHPKDKDYIVWELLHKTQEFYRGLL
jgi:hypothetical protein